MSGPTDRDESSETDDRSRSSGLPRRSVLQGTAALAGAGMFAKGFQGRPIEEHPTYEPPEYTKVNEPAPGGQVRRFTVHAIEVDIVYNRFGLHQPVGAMYVLEENLEAVREASGVTPGDGFELIDDDEQRIALAEDGDTASGDGQKSKAGKKGDHGDGPDDIDTSLIQPLVIRANEGDMVEIEFHNHLDRRASMHQTGLPYDVKDSDGMNVGTNPDTTVAPGGSITYRWMARHRGGHFFVDGANQAFDSADEPPQEANLASRSLFGTMVVEPKGATWSDPQTGEELRSGVRADVNDPNFMGTSYREFVVHYHTPEGIETADGGELIWPIEEEGGPVDDPGPQDNTPTPQSTHAINYRADPTGQRVNDECADCDDEEFFYNSWTQGDPGGGDNVYPTYKGDPIKFVPVGASLEENHVHHLHGHRWKQVPNDITSDTIDSQTIGFGASFPAFFTVGAGTGTDEHPEFTIRPEYTFEEAFEVGAGYAHGGVGDILFHCHLFPHYAEGMWAIMRIHDKEQDDLQPLPKTEIVDDPDPDALPLPSGQIIGADSDIPGFPDFIPNEQGNAPPNSPLATGENPEETGRQPTADEELAMGEIVPGAPYADPADPDDVDIEEPPVREYTIVALEADVVYNDAGDHDPRGKVYVLEEDADAVRNGDMNPEPLFIRANVGECVQITLKNELDHPVSVHPHFVGFDSLGSDSLANGYNYKQSTDPGEQREYRWFTDEEGTVFFHDHIVGIEEVMHGLFCGIIVEPPGAEYFDPYSGEPIESGSQAIISHPNGPDFREFCLHLHDFAQLVNRNGEFVNPDFEHNENAGTFGINLRNAPFYHRDDADSAYVYSSAVHGDPATPLLESYANDDIRMRVIQGSWEEQHNFQLHGRELEPEGVDLQDTVSPTIGTSEAFTFYIDDYAEEVNFQGFERMDNPAGLPVQDYLYGTGMVDDRWLGMWGIFRTFEAATPHLQPLPDRGVPGEEKNGKDANKLSIDDGPTSQVIANADADDPPITEADLRRMGHPAPFIGFDRLAKLGREAFLTYDGKRERKNGGDKSKKGGGKGHGNGRNDDRPFPPDKDARQNSSVGQVPPKAPDPGEPCPPDAPIRSFDVTALQTDISFNDYGDHDPHGIVFTLDEYAEDVEYGDRPTEPLLIRANQGDCIEINLTNALPAEIGDLEDELVALIEALRGLDLDIGGDLLGDIEDALGGDSAESKAKTGAKSKTKGKSGSKSGSELGLTGLLDALFGELCGAECNDEETKQAVDRSKSLVTALVEQLDGIGEYDNDHAHPKMRIEQEWERSHRISLHPQRVTYDVNGSDGATVGFNYDQTVAPGDTITYRWYAEEPFNYVVLWDEADLRSNRHHGAFGGLTIEPPGASWLDSRTAEPLPTGYNTIVTNPDGTDVREFAYTLSDSRYIVNRFDPESCVVPPGPEEEEPGGEEEGEGMPPCNQIGDPEDHGYRAINNRSEPFIRRFETGPDDQHLVYSSEEHGDPATPLPRALLDDPIKFLVSSPGDKSDGSVFHLSGHQWRRFRGVENSPIIGVDDRFTPGKSAQLDLVSGAGGLAQSTGDFIYQGDTREQRRLESGAWGIFRVRDDPTEFRTPVQPLSQTIVETGMPIDERPGWTVARGDMTGDGTNDVAIGVSDSDLADANAGAMYWYEGPVNESAITDLSDADIVLCGTTDERVGTDVTMTTPPDSPTADLVVETDTDTTYIVPGGEPLREVLANPPQTPLTDLLDNTTNSSIALAATITAVATEEGTQ